ARYRTATMLLLPSGPAPRWRSYHVPHVGMAPVPEAGHLEHGHDRGPGVHQVAALVVVGYGRPPGGAGVADGLVEVLEPDDGVAPVQDEGVLVSHHSFSFSSMVFSTRSRSSPFRGVRRPPGQGGSCQSPSQYRWGPCSPCSQWVWTKSAGI